MKKNMFFSGLVFALIFLMNSCTVYEDMTFHENGKLSYSLQFDMSQLSGFSLEPTNSMKNSHRRDSVVAFVDLFKNNKGETLDISELKEDLENAAPFKIRYTTDSDTQTSLMTLFGDFNNTDDFNKSLHSFGNLISKVAEKDAPNYQSSIDFKEWFSNMPVFTWDRIKMTRSSNPSSKKNEEESNSDNDIDFNRFQINSKLMMLLGCKMETSYHFPQKVESVSDSTATVSDDGKTISIEYSGDVFTENPEKTNIEIKTKNDNTEIDR